MVFPQLCVLSVATCSSQILLGYTAMGYLNRLVKVMVERLILLLMAPTRAICDLLITLSSDLVFL